MKDFWTVKRRILQAKRACPMWTVRWRCQTWRMEMRAWLRRAQLEIRESLGKTTILIASMSLDMKMREIVAIWENDHKKQLNCLHSSVVCPFWFYLDCVKLRPPLPHLVTGFFIQRRRRF